MSHRRRDRNRRRARSARRLSRMPGRTSAVHSDWRAGALVNSGARGHRSRLPRRAGASWTAGTEVTPAGVTATGAQHGARRHHDGSLVGRRAHRRDRDRAVIPVSPLPIPIYRLKLDATGASVALGNEPAWPIRPRPECDFAGRPQPGRGVGRLGLTRRDRGNGLRGAARDRLDDLRDRVGRVGGGVDDGRCRVGDRLGGRGGVDDGRCRVGDRVGDVGGGDLDDWAVPRR